MSITNQFHNHIYSILANVTYPKLSLSNSPSRENIIIGNLFSFSKIIITSRPHIVLTVWMSQRFTIGCVTMCKPSPIPCCRQYSHCCLDPGGSDYESRLLEIIFFFNSCERAWCSLVDLLPFPMKRMIVCVSLCTQSNYPNNEKKKIYYK